MPPSQLKRLKTSLRKSGVTCPQKSKKQRKSSKPSSTSNQQRHEQLQFLRDSFNPFEIRHPSSRPAKHQHATNGLSTAGKTYKDVLHRPGVTKSAGEEMRRKKLLPELRRKGKVGGIVDRRIGEGDGALNSEEKAARRFAAAKGRKSGLFDLEGSDDGDIIGADGEAGTGYSLTHGGRALDNLPADEFREDVGSENGSGEGDSLIRRKRRRLEDEDEHVVADEHQSDEDEPERKKSKKEVMHEVIAKSKVHKYERQRAKEDDDDLRDELDKGMDDIMSLLKGYKSPKVTPLPTATSNESTTNGAEPTMNPDRLKLLEGMDRDQADREYDTRLRQLAQDAKAKPSERTKTKEEKVREEAEKLRVLEEKRVSRMKGEDVSDVEAEEGEEGEDDGVPDEAAQFGFRASEATKAPQKEEQLVLEGEDEFALDENLIASGSDVDISDIESASGSENSAANGKQRDLEDEEDEFVKDVLGDLSDREKATTRVNGAALAFTYPCPRTHSELQDIFKDTSIVQLPTIIQHIRALHHPSLSADNKEAMADFSAVLVEHLSYMGLHKGALHITEQVIRHLHSLSRTYPSRIAEACRQQLREAHQRQNLHAGDFVVLTAIGSIYPTSDHWHQVVTPAMTLMARWLELNAPNTNEKEKKGTFLVALCVSFQRLSKRLVPEALRFTLQALITKTASHKEQRAAHVLNLMAMAELWKDKSAFIELFTPAVPLLNSASTKREHQTLKILLSQACLRRRPLELHHHRPLPIRTSIPKFEEGFKPDRHHDPNRERSEGKKLLKEYKRERKGALRELRKDANFIARQRLGEKKAADAEYAAKQRRLVAEIQGEAAHDAKEYEREKERGRNRQKGGKGKGGKVR